MTPVLKDADIGGGVVLRRFQFGADRPGGGTKLTAAQVLSMNPKNRRELVRLGYLSVFPRADTLPDYQPADPLAGAERHIVHNGGGRYDVIAGVKLNDAALSREEAEELATRPN
jgi:hypothetical protein